MYGTLVSEGPHCLPSYTLLLERTRASLTSRQLCMAFMVSEASWRLPKYSLNVIVTKCILL